MILAVSGWREWKDIQFLADELQKMQQRGYNQLRVGDCRGVDAIIWRISDIVWNPYQWKTRQKFEATWRNDNNQFIKAGGAIRNHAMLTDNGEHADLLLAFPQPGKRRSNSGTWMCVDQALELGITVYIPGYKKR